MPNIYNIALDRNIPKDAVYVGRNPKHGSVKYGNKFKIGPKTPREKVIALHREDVESDAQMLRDLDELQGRDLVCHCMPAPCHAETLMRLANDPERRAELIRKIEGNFENVYVAKQSAAEKEDVFEQISYLFRGPR